MVTGAAFWSGRRVFLTGHTGFKGAWLSLWLADLGAEPRQRIFHHAGGDSRTVVGDDCVRGLVDQAHGEQRGRLHLARGVLLGATNLVHVVGQAAAGCRVGEDGIAIEGKEHFLHLVQVASLARDVKFIHKCLDSVQLSFAVLSW